MANKYIKSDEIKKILDELAHNGECEMSYGPYSDSELAQEVMSELAGVRLPGYSCQFNLEQQDEGTLVKFTISRDRIKGSPRKDPREDKKEVSLTPDQQADINSHNKQWLGNDTRKIEKTVSSSSDIVLHPDEAKQMADLFRKAREESRKAQEKPEDLTEKYIDVSHKIMNGSYKSSSAILAPDGPSRTLDTRPFDVNPEAKIIESENSEPNIIGPSRGVK